MTIDDMMKQVFDSLEVGTRIYAEFEHYGGRLYSGEFKVIWINKGKYCISLTTPNESPYGTCIGVPLKNFFSLVNISNTNKEESNMTDYGRKLEREYRDGMVVGAIYNFIGKGTHGWKYRYRLIGFEGCGEDLLLIFKSINNDSEFRIMADDMGGFHLISKPTEEKKDKTDMKFLDEFDEIFDKKLRKIMVDISKLTEEKKEETNTNNFDEDEMFEKRWRARMVVGNKYDIIGKAPDFRVEHNITFLRSYGHGLDFTLAFEYSNHERLDIKASDIYSAYPISCSNTLPEPMQLVKKIEGYSFDEKAFYRATNGVRHFLIKDLDDNYRYEAFYYGPTLDGAGMHITFGRTVGCGNVTCESAELYHDEIKCDPIMTNFKLFKGDSVCTHEEIKIDDIFKKEEKLEWDIDKLKVGKAYRIQDSEGNETDGIYTRLYETAVPGQSSIAFTVLSDNRADGAHHVYLGELASGKIKIYELTCRKGNDEE